MLRGQISGLYRVSDLQLPAPEPKHHLLSVSVYMSGTKILQYENAIIYMSAWLHTHRPKSTLLYMQLGKIVRFLTSYPRHTILNATAIRLKNFSLHDFYPHRYTSCFCPHRRLLTMKNNQPNPNFVGGIRWKIDIFGQCSVQDTTKMATNMDKTEVWERQRYHTICLTFLNNLVPT